MAATPAHGLWTDWGNITPTWLYLPSQDTVSSPKILTINQHLLCVTGPLKPDNFYEKSQHLTAILNALISNAL